MEKPDKIYVSEIAGQEKMKSPETEPSADIPIINIIRHGETDYKELTDKNFQFDPQVKDMVNNIDLLDPKEEDLDMIEKHLDLNKEGIKNILKTAEQIAGSVNKENEVVLFVTSPNFRTQSSMLLMRAYFEKAGIAMFGKILKVRSIGQIKLKPEVRDSNFLRDKWMPEEKKYKEEVERKNIKFAPENAHREITKRLELEWDRIFDENYDQIDRRFEIFLRHMTNIKMSLSERTKKELEGKQIRIITLTHEEVPARFMNKLFGEDAGLKKAQNLELVPYNQLSDDKIIIKATLYPKGSEDTGEPSVK